MPVVYLAEGTPAELVENLPSGKVLIRRIYEVEVTAYDCTEVVEELGALEIVDKVFSKRPKIIELPELVEARENLTAVNTEINEQKKELVRLRREFAGKKREAADLLTEVEKLAPDLRVFLDVMDGKYTHVVAFPNGNNCPSLYKIDEVSLGSMYEKRHLDLFFFGVTAINGKLKPKLMLGRSRYGDSLTTVHLFHSNAEAAEYIYSKLSKYVDAVADAAETAPAHFDRMPNISVTTTTFTSIGLEPPAKLIEAEKLWKQRRAEYKIECAQRALDKLKKEAKGMDDEL